MKRSLHVFWSPEDEDLFSQTCMDRRLRVVFVNDCYWPTPTPPTHSRLRDCTAKLVYLWNRDLVPELPCKLHSDGARYHGPQSGIVIQLLRGAIQGNELKYGTISIAFDESDDEYARWVIAVFNVVQKISVRGLACVEPSTGEVLTSNPPMFRAGPNAAAWVRDEPGRFFRDNTAMNHYGIVG